MSEPEYIFPYNVQVQFSGFEQNEFFEALKERLVGVSLELGKLMDLSRLERIYVTFDLGETLKSIDLGYSSTQPQSFTNNDDLLAVAKCVNVLRDEQVKVVVVFTAEAIAGLGLDGEDGQRRSVGIIAHEFAHVAGLKITEEAFPEFTLKHHFEDFNESVFLGNSVTIWDEYFACRLSGYIDRATALPEMIDLFDNLVSKAFPSAQQALYEYQVKHDMMAAISKVGNAMVEPLRIGGYLLGYLDSTDSEDSLSDLLPDDIPCFFRTMLGDMHSALNSVWELIGNWESMDVFEDIEALIDRSFRAGGVTLGYKNGESYAYIERNVNPDEK